jgi:hypothetical protein
MDMNGGCCGFCENFSVSDEDYYCCIVNNHVLYSFDLQSLEENCPL